jgi:ABC-type phosphonate transport system ATPase subunit
MSLNLEVLRVKLEFSNVWVVKDFPVRLLCDRLLPIQSGVVLDFGHSERLHF